MPGAAVKACATAQRRAVSRGEDSSVAVHAVARADRTHFGNRAQKLDNDRRRAIAAAELGSCIHFGQDYLSSDVSSASLRITVGRRALERRRAGVEQEQSWG